MKLVVGLGNPGEQYTNTRHNIGFWLVKSLSRFHDFSGPKAQCKGRLWSGIVGDVSVKSLLPGTYMNGSGESVQSALQFYRLTHTDLIVVYDDFELPFGTVRIREKGTAGTHNGMRSIIQCIGTTNFVRMRIGVGPIPEGRLPADFVLSRFSCEEQSIRSTKKSQWVKRMDLLIHDRVQQAQAPTDD
ncbi:MAG: aminoacyl-tRNA hydrolase [Candidatus Marinamargulisbacteria bacterium]|jgi:peptidyl-tRNA hydrolase, PTH1 family|nr:aminoacyl-tRNA hydrolase [Candidatus Marinamargulisbacteria bacterium]